MSSDPQQSSVPSFKDEGGPSVNEHDQNSSSSANLNTAKVSPDLAERSSTSDLDKKVYTIQDLVTTPPPTFKDRLHRYFFEKGLADRPEYLQRIYQKIPRYIFVNQPLPTEMTVGFISGESNGTQDTHPILHYPYNKIRTTKYTPLSFIPKNLLTQFRNVANIYFLILIILGAFQVFGVASPGLAAVPLIVIVCITALKDAFEDYRRAISDSQLNNSPIHLLSGLENPNVLVNEVSSWRKFKKACSRATAKTFHGIHRFWVLTFGRKERKSEFIRQEHHENENALHRVSTIVSDYTYNSADLANQATQTNQGRPSVSSPRRSLQSERRRSKHLGPPPPPTKPTGKTFLNPVLQQENLTNFPDLRATFKNRRWKDVALGDIIRVRANEEVPADIVVLSTSDAEGSCYIETKNLDGETNLKTKKALEAGGTNHLKHSQDFLSAKFWVECDAPNPNLYAFRGTAHYENFDDRGNLINSDEKEPITNDNVLLRGSTLRNTKWVIGLAIYTGEETKIMLNSGITPTKISKISRELNLSVIINFALLFILCFISGVVNGTFYNQKHVSRLYFDFKPYSPTAAGNGTLAFFVALIIYQSLVPISLYISVEIIKTLQAFFIFSDNKMYYEKLDFPCIPKAWNISDDLGQIEYVFSDKTGTLTQNVMEFKKCTIAGKSYGLAYTEAKQGLDKRAGLDTVVEGEKWKRIIAKDKEAMFESLLKNTSNDQLREENVTFVSNEYVQDTILADENSRQRIANDQFMLALSLCHTVVTEESETDPGLRDFKAESPDDAALVAVARDVGIVFKDRFRNLIHITTYGVDAEYELVDLIPFTSTRKRMSCIVLTPENKYLLISKGADDVIYQRLTSSSSLNSDEILHKTALHLEDYAKEGLRTLCIAQRELDPKEYKEWSVRYRDAHASMDDSRDEIIDNLTNEIEKDLTLLGGTAIEDRLQAGVPDSISILGQAGIKLWVLTGDRIETAINIGFSCNLLENSMKLLVVRPEEDDLGNAAYLDGLITKHLQENFGLLSQTNTEEEIDRLIAEARKDHSTPTTNHALIIDGAALSLIFRDPLTDENYDPNVTKLQEKFLLLGKQCKSVICCRVSPAQKAQVVLMVKNNLGVMTLAIGDGANDVAMIQASNVGVGIAGEEGRQAVMSSDYAIGQFRFLTRLLLVHGRWSYKRLAEMVPCFFYKNVVFTMTCFWYGIYNDFDGSYLFEYTFLTFYNLAFTSLPVIVMGILDQDVSDTVSLLVPQLYRSGILGKEWSQYKFAWYMLDGIYQSVVAFFFPYLLYYKGFQNPQGMTVDHRFWIGVTVCTVSVTACNIYVVLRQNRWDWISMLVDAISILLVFFWTGVWSARVSAAGEFFKAGAQTLGTLGVWCVFFISVVLCVLPRFTFEFLRSNFKPKDIDIVREMVRSGKFDDYPSGYDPTDAEDIERHRILTQIIETDPAVLEKLEREQYPEYHKDEIKEEQGETVHGLSKTFKSIKRKTTLSRSKRDSQRSGSRSRRETLIENFRHPLDINELRKQMIKDGEYNTGSKNSLDRINTSHALPGLTQAETLISYHTRNSINLAR